MLHFLQRCYTFCTGVTLFALVLHFLHWCYTFLPVLHFLHWCYTFCTGVTLFALACKVCPLDCKVCFGSKFTSSTEGRGFNWLIYDSMTSLFACGRFSKSRGLSASVSFVPSPSPHPSFTHSIHDHRPVILSSRTAQKRSLRRLFLHRCYTFCTGVTLFALVLHFLHWFYTFLHWCCNFCTGVTLFVPVLHFLHWCYTFCTGVTLFVPVLHFFALVLHFLHWCYIFCTGVTLFALVLHFLHWCYTFCTGVKLSALVLHFLHRCY